MAPEGWGLAKRHEVMPRGSIVVSHALRPLSAGLWPRRGGILTSTYGSPTPAISPSSLLSGHRTRFFRGLVPGARDQQGGPASPQLSVSVEALRGQTVRRFLASKGGDAIIDTMEATKYIYWQDSTLWLGYLQDYPDYWTQGESLEELQSNLRDLYRDLTSGEIPGVRKLAELTLQ